MGYLASQGKTDVKTIRTAVAVGSVVASFTVEGFSLDSLEKADIRVSAGVSRFEENCTV